jgi:hypothetical protein
MPATSKTPKLAVGLLLAGSQGLCACQCATSVMGVRDGDRVQTTIVAPYSGVAPAGGYATSTTSCTDLGDLVPGTTLTIKMSVQTEAADGCIGVVHIGEVQATNEPWLSPSSFDTVAFQGPSGCDGLSRLDFVAVGSNPSLLSNDNSADGGAVAWLLVRNFTATSDGGCNVASCSDFFVATNKKL